MVRAKEKVVSFSSTRNCYIFHKRRRTVTYFGKQKTSDPTSIPVLAKNTGTKIGIWDMRKTSCWKSIYSCCHKFIEIFEITNPRSTYRSPFIFKAIKRTFDLSLQSLLQFMPYFRSPRAASLDL